MLFCQVWMARRATRYNLVKPQTFPLENSRSSNSGLRFSLVFWMSLYKDYSIPSSFTSTLFSSKIGAISEKNNAREKVL